MTARDDAEVVEAAAGVLCASRDLTDDRHEAQDVPCGPCFRDAAALLPFIREREASALREAADGWTQGAWANHMVHASDPAQIRIGSANRFGQWLRDRAAALTDGGGDGGL